jgi:hypothetical protein
LDRHEAAHFSEGGVVFSLVFVRPLDLSRALNGVLVRGLALPPRPRLNLLLEREDANAQVERKVAFF